MNDENIKSLENDIKAEALNYLIKRNELKSSDIIINEFTLDKHSRRVDLVWLKNKRLYALEIKSESDSLSRLNGQLSKYLEYFDKVIVVAASKHIPRIQKTVSKNIAVWEFINGDIKVVQQGKIVQITAKDKFLSIMKANELVRLSRELDLSPPCLNRKGVEKALAKVSINNLRQFAIKNLRQRYRLTSMRFWQKVGAEKITPGDIDLLSPYKHDRLLRKITQQENEFFWNNLLTEDERTNFLAMVKVYDNAAFGPVPKKIEKLLAT